MTQDRKSSWSSARTLESELPHCRHSVAHRVTCCARGVASLVLEGAPPDVVQERADGCAGRRDTEPVRGLQQRIQPVGPRARARPDGHAWIMFFRHQFWSDRTNKCLLTRNKVPTISTAGVCVRFRCICSQPPIVQIMLGAGRQASACGLIRRSTNTWRIIRCNAVVNRSLALASWYGDCRGMRRGRA